MLSDLIIRAEHSMQTNSDVIAQKSLLRREMRQKRDILSVEFRHRASKQVAMHANRFLVRGKRIGVYWAYGSELNLAPLIEKALKRGALVYLPKTPIRGRRLGFCRLMDLYSGSDNSRVKAIGSSSWLKRADHLDVILVPLLSIDDAGYRLGQGGGFYDATLAFRKHGRATRKPRVIGVAYHCQCVKEVPRTSWDIPLDALVTEYGFRWF